MSELTYIYSLEYPKGNIRYIGKTDNLKSRLKGHLEKLGGTSHKNSWIKGLLNKNLKPIIKEIDRIPVSEWQFWETHYIFLFRSWGFSLTNLTFGGDGLSNPTKEVRNKISDSLKKKYSSGGLVTWNKGIETGHTPWNKDLPATKELKDKVSISCKKTFEDGRETWNKGKKLHYDVWNKGKKNVMPEPWNKDIPMDKEISNKISESCKKTFENGREVWNKGKAWNEEVKEKLRKKVTCPHCDKTGGVCAMKRWHFDNCKYKTKAA